MIAIRISPLLRFWVFWICTQLAFYILHDSFLWTYSKSSWYNIFIFYKLGKVSCLSGLHPFLFELVLTPFLLCQFVVNFCCYENYFHENWNNPKQFLSKFMLFEYLVSTMIKWNFPNPSIFIFLLIHLFLFYIVTILPLHTLIFVEIYLFFSFF